MTEQPLTGTVTQPRAVPGETSPAVRHQRVALVDLLDRVLAGGVVIVGEVRLSIADVDLVSISLRALISSVSTVLAHDGDLPDLGT
ncbi:MAG TPA: gas vesicle protein [Streptosporangiaceae bacterium]|nr:gas vesicle protein [Streptosporangiaceae bacterium]